MSIIYHLNTSHIVAGAVIYLLRIYDLACGLWCGATMVIIMVATVGFEGFNLGSNWAQSQEGRSSDSQVL